MVPVDAVALVIPHPGEEHAAGFSLPDDILDHLWTPVVVLPVVERVPPDS